METSSWDNPYDRGEDENPYKEQHAASLEGVWDVGMPYDNKEEDKRIRLFDRVMGVRAELHVYGVTTAEKNGMEIKSKDLSNYDNDLTDDPGIELLSVKRNIEVCLSFNQFGVTITEGTAVTQAEYAALSEEQLSLVDQALKDAAMVFFEE